MNSKTGDTALEKLVCSGCQHNNRMENKFCTKCGEELAARELIGPCLTVLTREKSSIIFHLRKRNNTIGRNIKNTIVINDDLISNFHAAVLLEGNQSKISDLESKNGIYLNGMKVQNSAVLRDGNLIKLGSTILRYETSRENEITNKVDET